MESILYARLPDDIVVVRVVGKGNHNNSLALREVLTQTGGAGDAGPRYIFDLEKCDTMDSTFMGVMASVALKQRRAGTGKAVVVNANPHVQGLLNTLGLKYILDIRAPADAGVDLSKDHDKFVSAPAPQVDKLNRIILMIEAHEKLIDADGGNEVQFKGVLQSLRDSLDRARGQKP